MVKRTDDNNPVLGQKLAAAIKKAAKKAPANPKAPSIPRSTTASVRVRISVPKKVVELVTTTPTPVAAVHQQAFEELQVSMEGLNKELGQVIDLPIPKFLPPKSEEVVMEKVHVIQEPVSEVKSENQDEVLENLNKAIEKRVQANKAKATFRNVVFKSLAVVGAIAAIVTGAQIARK